MKRLIFWNPVFRMSLVGAFLLGLFGFVLVQNVDAAEVKKPAKKPFGLKLGGVLPDFSLPGVDGKTHAKAEYAKYPVLVLVFTSNHCPASQSYEERLLKLDADYLKKGVKLIALMSNNARALRLDENRFSDVEDTLEGMKIRAKDMKFTFPYLYDGKTQKLGRAVGARATPHAFIFDKDRKLCYSGGIDDKPDAVPTRHYLRDAIDDLLAGRAVKKATSRTFGCSTKWLEKEARVLQAEKEWKKKSVKADTIKVADLEKLVKGDGENHLLINVWSPSCVSCIAELPDVVKLHRIYKSRSVKVISLGLTNSTKGLPIVQKAHMAEMPNLLFDGDREKMADALDKPWQGELPYTVIINPKGKVVYRKSGAFDMLEVRREIVDRLGRTRALRPAKRITDAEKKEAVGKSAAGKEK